MTSVSASWPFGELSRRRVVLSASCPWTVDSIVDLLWTFCGYWARAPVSGGRGRKSLDDRPFCPIQGKNCRRHCTNCIIVWLYEDSNTNQKLISRPTHSRERLMFLSNFISSASDRKRSSFAQYFLYIRLGPTFLDNGSQPSLNGSPQNSHTSTSLLWGQAWNLLSKFFYITPKIWRGKPPISPIFRRPAVNRKRVTSKWLNISTNKKYIFHLR